MVFRNCCIVARGLVTGATYPVLVFMLLFSCHLQSEDHTSSLNHAHDPGSAQSHAHHTSGSTSGEEQYGVSELFKPDNASKNSREAGPALGGQEAPSRPSGGTPPEVQPKEGEPKPPPSLVTDQKLKVKVCVVCESESLCCVFVCGV